MRALLSQTSFLPKAFEDGSTCVLPISVGWDYHEGEAFQATIDLVCQRFSFCRVVVCDTLQRHSLRFASGLLKSEVEVWDSSLHDGDAWLERNKCYLQTLSVPHIITRWSQYLNEPSYHYYHHKLDTLLKNDKKLNELVIQSAEAVYNKFVGSGRVSEDPSLRARFLKASTAYQQEEIAVVMSWETMREDILLYPKNLGDGMKAVMDSVWGRERSFLQPLQIKFK